MMSMFLFPRLIPKKRFSSTIISIILASAIFSGTIIGISTLDQQSTNFFDTRPNTTIIYDTTVNTPFTSRIPKEVVKSLDILPGVLSYSEEVLQPAVINEQPAFFRGVNLLHLAQFDPSFRIVEGANNLTSLDPGTAIVGKILQARFNIRLGDRIFVSSTISGRSTWVEIVGFFESKLPYQYELLLSVDTAQYLASFTAQYTHVQVNYDPFRLDSETISDLLTQKFEVIINIGFDNGSEISELQLSILDIENKGLVSGPANASQRYFFPAGQYRLILRSPYEILRDQKFQVIDDTKLTIRTGEYVFDVTLNLTYKGLPFSNFSYIISSERDTLSGNSTENNLHLNLRKGNYTLTVPFGTQEMNVDFTVTGSITQTIDVFDHLPAISFSEPQGITYLSSEIALKVENLLPHQKLRLISENGTELISGLNADIEHGLVRISAPDGSYVLQVLEPKTDPTTIVGEFRFSINTQKSILVSALVDYAHYLPFEMVTASVSVDAIDEIRVLINKEQTSFSMTDKVIQFHIPSENGLYSIQFQLIDHLGNMFVKTYNIIVDRNANLAGWRLPTPSPMIYPAIGYPIWHRSAVVSVPTNWSYAPVSEGFGYLIANHTINQSEIAIQLTTGIVQLNVTPPASLFSLVSIENSTGIPLNITSGIQLNTSDMIFLYDPFLLDLKLTLAGDSYSVTPNIPYSVPSYASNATLQIYQKIGQSSFLVDEFSWKVNDTASIPDLPTPHIQFLNNSATGQFELDDYLYSFEHLDGMTFIPTRLSPTRIVLPPGEFRVTVTDSNNNSFSFVLDVPSYTSKGRYVAFNSPLLSFSEGYLIGANETFILRDGVYFDGLGNPFFVATSPGFSMPALPYTTNASFVDLVISGARHIEYSINYQNGTMMAGVYNSSIFLNSPIMEEVSLYLAVTDRFGKVHIYDTVVALNQVRNPYSIRVAMRDNSSFPILGLEVQIQQVGVITAFLNNAETTVQLFDHQLTIQNVFTSGIAISFDYSVNYSSREIDLQIFDPWIRIYTNNLNEGLTDAYAGPLIIRDLKSGLMVFNGNISKLQRISIPGSNYSASIVIDDTPYLFQFSVEFARNMAFDLPIKYQEISLTVTKQGNFYIKDIIFQHEILGIIHSGKSERTSSDLEIWSIQSFPYGKMNIKVILSNSRTHLIQLNTEDIPFISIEVTLDFSGINNQFVDSTLLNKGAINVNLGAVSSSAYLESFLGNLITLVKLVFLAEIIVISFILVINILRSIDFFVVLSKKELRTLLSIGTSKGSSILLVSRELFVVTPILSLIGYFAGYGLLSYFVELNHLTLFGKDLTLNPWQLPLILTNLFAVFVMVIVSVFVEIKRINEENLREN